MDRERLRALLEEKGISQSELARRVGISQGSVHQLLTGRIGRTRVLGKIAEELGVSEAWLEGTSDEPERSEFGSLAIDDVRDRLGIVRLPQIDVGYAMGAGTFVPDNPETEWAHFDARWLGLITRSSPDKLFVALGIGDSMFPTLLDRDLLIVDRGHTKINQQDRVWAITYGDLGMIKRVRRLPSGAFLIMSDNAAVSDFEADPSEMHIIGRVVWAARTI